MDELARLETAGMGIPPERSHVAIGARAAGAWSGRAPVVALDDALQLVIHLEQALRPPRVAVGPRGGRVRTTALHCFGNSVASSCWCRGRVVFRQILRAQRERAPLCRADDALRAASLRHRGGGDVGGDDDDVGDATSPTRSIWDGELHVRTARRRGVRTGRGRRSTRNLAQPLDARRSPTPSDTHHAIPHAAARSILQQ